MHRTLAAVGALVVGCGSSASPTPDAAVPEPSAVSIRQAQAPQLNAGTCSYSDDPTAPAVTTGVLDVGVGESYALTPLVANLLPGAVTLDSFAVELHDTSATGALVVPQYSDYQELTVPAAPTGVPGYAHTRINLIPTQVGAALRAQVCAIDNTGVTDACPVPRVVSHDRHLVAQVIALGSTADGSVVSSPFYFPLTVCCGCLINFPADSVDPASPVPNCNQGTAPMTAAQCAPGQDDPLDCRTCAASNPGFCQPRGYSPTGATCPR